MVRRFFLVAAGTLMLALAYHLAASNASAQNTGNPVVGIASDGAQLGHYMVVTANGDVYVNNNDGLSSWQHRTSISSATPVQQESWSQVKARYQITPGMTVTPGAERR